MKKEEAIIFFDGVCNLCNGAVNLIIKLDHQRVFKFCSLQSELGRKVSAQIGHGDLMGSLIVKHGETLLTKSNAALFIASKLGYPYKLLTIGYIIPKMIRDRIYDWIAKSRYKWFGKSQECMIPTPELNERFVG